MKVFEYCWIVLLVLLDFAIPAARLPDLPSRWVGYVNHLVYEPRRLRLKKERQNRSSEHWDVSRPGARHR